MKEFSNEKLREISEDNLNMAHRRLNVNTLLSYLMLIDFILYLNNVIDFNSYLIGLSIFIISYIINHIKYKKNTKKIEEIIQELKNRNNL
jgi:Na+/melibiose symporter-like transporter